MEIVDVDNDDKMRNHFVVLRRLELNGNNHKKIKGHLKL
jgi:hypothetical protein